MVRLRLRTLHFNPRSREGSDLKSVDNFSSKFDFNPRSREGSDPGIRVLPHGGHRISIHAPVKGATPVWQIPRVSRWISIHAPVKGATLTMAAHTATQSNFNPRSREGSDLRR